MDEFASYVQRAKFPYISANLDFTNVTLSPDTPSIQIGVDADNCLSSISKIVKSCYYDYGDFRVGLIATSPSNLFDSILSKVVGIYSLSFQRLLKESSRLVLLDGDPKRQPRHKT